MKMNMLSTNFMASATRLIRHFFCVIYLRRIVNGRSDASFIFGKSRVILSHQQNWVISRKELEAAKLCSDLMLLALAALQHLSCAC